MKYCTISSNLISLFFPLLQVGIPYPNAKDNLVKLKKDFNNEFRLKNNDILTGDKWYQIQAYR